MVITETVYVRGKQLNVSSLKHSSSIKVEVRCPECKLVRKVHYKSIAMAGHTVCQKCATARQAKKLNIGKQYGFLTIIAEGSPGYSWCRCICGAEKQIKNYKIQRGQASCGCLKKKNFNNVIRPKGEKHGMWRGGSSKQRERAMQTQEYKEWRAAVFIRDNHTCQKCFQVGHKINAHHIFDYTNHESIRYEYGNGITLCVNCHNKFHKLFGRKNTLKQLQKFLEQYEVTLS